MTPAPRRREPNERTTVNRYRITTVDGNHVTREADGPMDALTIFYSDFAFEEQPEVACVELRAKLSEGI